MKLLTLRSLGLLAAVLVVAACAQNPAPTAGTGGPPGAGVGAPVPPTRLHRGAASPGSREEFMQNIGDRVFFAFNRSDISAEGQGTLQRQAEWLKRYDNVTVTIEGHADDRGTREFNLALGNRRAAAVKGVLISLGVAGNRIAVISYGKERPIVVGDNEQAWAQNRVAITIIN